MTQLENPKNFLKDTRNFVYSPFGFLGEEPLKKVPKRTRSTLLHICELNQLLC